MIRQILKFAPEYAGIIVRSMSDRLRAVLASLRFDPHEHLIDKQFLRWSNYEWIKDRLGDKLRDGGGLRAIEFGGSNGVISRMVPDWQFEVAPNFPEVDIEDLRQYEAGTFDVVVLDQVLEHVADDERAVAEVHRILRPGGMLIATTPFLIQVHGYPHDYRRYTAEGLRRLFRAFSPIELQTWGNRFSVQVIAKFGWLTSRNAKRLFVVAPWNEPDWPIDCAVICWK